MAYSSFGEGDVIPVHTPEPKIELLTKTQCAESIIVVFDVETTGFEFEADICQLSAVTVKEGTLKFFDVYVIPDKEISPRASSVTQIEKINGQLLFRGLPVPAKTILDALNSFLDFLMALGSPIILLAHNCFTFDQRMLCSAIVNCGLEAEFQLIVLGMVDSLPLCKELLPERSGYNLQSLITDEIQAGFEAHNSLEDSKMLQLLVRKLDPTPEILSRYSRTISYSFNKFRYSSMAKRNEKTFYKLKQCTDLSNSVITKMAMSGLSLSHLKSLYLKGGPDAIDAILSEGIESGKPRVTKNSSVIFTICEFLQNEAVLH